ARERAFARDVARIAAHVEPHARRHGEVELRLQAARDRAEEGLLLLLFAQDPDAHSVARLLDVDLRVCEALVRLLLRTGGGGELRRERGRARRGRPHPDSAVPHVDVEELPRGEIEGMRLLPRRRLALEKPEMDSALGADDAGGDETETEQQ